MYTSVVIPTYNRPKDLNECLDSISKQTVLPDEVIVVDDGDLGDIPRRKELEAKNVNCVYIKKRSDQRGLTRSRNIGVKASKGDVIFFFDDDVILEPDYLKLMLFAYKNIHDTRLGGIAGSEINYSKRTIFQFIEYFFNVIFLISPVRPCRITPSGFTETLITNHIWRLPLRSRLFKADFLGGSNFSFKAEVFKYYMFLEDYKENICMGEDKDFTLLVSQKYNLYVFPKARLYHKRSPVMRANKYLNSYLLLLSYYRKLKLHKENNPFNKLLFFYSACGLVFKRILITLLTREQGDKDRLRGTIEALRQILFSKE